jgi:hypothetical protein
MGQLAMKKFCCPKKPGFFTDNALIKFPQGVKALARVMGLCLSGVNYVK